MVGVGQGAEISIEWGVSLMFVFADYATKQEDSSFSTSLILSILKLKRLIGSRTPGLATVLLAEAFYFNRPLELDFVLCLFFLLTTHEFSIERKKAMP